MSYNDQKKGRKKTSRLQININVWEQTRRWSTVSTHNWPPKKSLPTVKVVKGVILDVSWLAVDTLPLCAPHLTAPQ